MTSPFDAVLAVKGPRKYDPKMHVSTNTYIGFQFADIVQAHVRHGACTETISVD